MTEFHCSKQYIMTSAKQKRDVLSENSACATFLPIVLSWFNGLSVFSHLVYLSNTSNDLRPAKRTYKQNLLRPHHLLTSKVRKLLLKVMHYNIALLPKKVTNYVTYFLNMSRA